MTDVTVKAEPRVYEPNSPHSFFIDIARSKALHDERAAQRLERHAVEERALTTTLGNAGEFSPPAYLIEDFATAAKVGRHFADLIGSTPIPRGVSTIYVPRIIGSNILGQDTGAQNNLEPVPNTDDTTAQNSSPVVTISGRVVMSQQLFDQAASPGADTIYYAELVKDYNAVLNGMMINGTGTNGQFTGLANFSYLTANTVSGSSVPAALTGASNMIAALWPLMGQAAANVGNNRGHRPDFWLMAPRRWFAIAGGLDQQSRPIMNPSAQAPSSMASANGPTPVSNIHGIPVYTDGAVPVTNYPSGTVGALADTIYCGRVADTYLFESPPMVQTSVNATSGTLQVSLVWHRYAAFVGNLYTSAYGRVTSIPQPTNY